MPFNVGDLVMCIGDDWEKAGNPRWMPPHLPVKGCVYTVRNVFNYTTPAPGLLLYEVVNPTPGTHWKTGARIPDEVSFIHLAFRPVRKTSIDVFRSALVPIEAIKPPKVPAGT